MKKFILFLPICILLYVFVPTMGSFTVDAKKDEPIVYMLPPGDGPPPLDGKSFDTARPITIGSVGTTTQYTSFDGLGTEDEYYYEFIAPATVVYDLKIKLLDAPRPISVYLYDENRQSIEDRYNDSGGDTVDFGRRIFDQGKTYYIKIVNNFYYPYYGKWEIDIFREDNNTYECPETMSSLVSNSFDYIGDEDYFNFTPTDDVVLKIYSNYNIIGYVLSGNNSVLTYDTINDSTLNMYYAFEGGVTYKIKITSSYKGSYLVQTSNSIGNHVIKPNSTEIITESVVYEADDTLIGKQVEGYFLNSEDAKDYLRTQLSTFEDKIVDMVVCVVTGIGYGAYIGGPVGAAGGTLAGFACSYITLLASQSLDNVVNEMTDLVNDIQGNKIYLNYDGNYQYEVLIWDGQNYAYSDIYQKDYNYTIDAY